jgi:hypothetical protein
LLQFPPSEYASDVEGIENVIPDIVRLSQLLLFPQEMPNPKVLRFKVISWNNGKQRDAVLLAKGTTTMCTASKLEAK